MLARNCLEGHAERHGIVGGREGIGIAKINLVLSLRDFGMHGFDNDPK